jgi:hypothetical protein
MRSTWVGLMLLGMGAVVAAQESRFNLLDDKELPGILASEDQDKKDGQVDKTVEVRAGKLQDELPVGEYRRPMWTLHRPSPTTRIYLQVDSGEVEFEQWLDIRLDKKRSDPDDRVRMSTEFEFGLGYRLQLDLYANTIFTRAGGASTLAIRSWAAELRYALADWGVIWGNPTLYFEYINWNAGQGDAHADAASASWEVKLLLGDELGHGWRWGANFVYEATFNDAVREHAITYSLLKTIVDTLLSGGITAKFVYTAEVDTPGQPKSRDRELYVGPNIQVRLAPYKTEMESEGKKVTVTRTKAHLDLEPLFGLTGESKRAQVLIVFGWDF